MARERLQKTSKERLQKVLAAAGFGSRRACEEIILAGRVSVNGQPVDTLPVLVDPQTDKIQVDGMRVRIEPKVYLLLNKPKGVLSTASDPEGRRTVVDLVADVGVRVFPVGRLDKDSEGLVLMTNDGELTKRLTHPRYEVERVYVAHVKGEVEGSIVETMRNGIWLSDGRARAKRIRFIKKSRQESILEVVLTQGMNRQVRRMLAKLGLPVKKLVRVRYGSLDLSGAKPGKYRHLTKKEVGGLKTLVKSG
ncbi:MAG: rRNA pseudouridine synthase [Phycisphaerae bacterium]|nr:rRNA pseudouridine synthase [Phycisphaerae bacterium]